MRDDTNARGDRTGEDPTIEQERVRRFVREHDVRWRRVPIATYAVGPAPVTIGFTVELHAAHLHPKHVPSPGCDECVDLHAGLVEVVRAAMPIVGPDTLFELRPFTGTLVFAPARGGREEVVLDVDVVHVAGVGPVDECERRCLGKLEAALSDLGAHRLLVAARRRRRERRIGTTRVRRTPRRCELGPGRRLVEARARTLG